MFNTISGLTTVRKIINKLSWLQLSEEFHSHIHSSFLLWLTRPCNKLTCLQVFPHLQISQRSQTVQNSLYNRTHTLHSHLFLTCTQQHRYISLPKKARRFSFLHSNKNNFKKLTGACFFKWKPCLYRPLLQGFQACEQGHITQVCVLWHHLTCWVQESGLKLMADLATSQTFFFSYMARNHDGLPQNT